MLCLEGIRKMVFQPSGFCYRGPNQLGERTLFELVGFGFICPDFGGTRASGP